MNGKHSAAIWCLMCDQDHIICYISSCGDSVKFGRTQHRTHVSQLSRTPVVQSALDQCDGAGYTCNCVHAAGVIKYAGEVTHMTMMDGPMREQYDLWKGIRPSVRLFRFKVLEVSQLDSLQPLQQFSNR
eukprot:4021849-Pyramimonas_sp.AAC.1